MRAYTFDFLNHDGSIDTFDIGAFADDVEASARARAALGGNLTAVAVEIWSEGVAVAAIRREGPPPGFMLAQSRALSRKPRRTSAPSA